MVMYEVELFLLTVVIIYGLASAFCWAIKRLKKDKMSNVFSDIIEWNKARNNLEFVQNSEYKMLAEELLEFETSQNEYEAVDALCDLIVVATGGLFKLGYDPEKCMNEVIKHISSRQQDPFQYMEWDTNGASGKWLKNKQQDPSTIYQPKFEECKL